MESWRPKTNQRDHNRPDKGHEQNIIYIQIVILNHNISGRDPNNDERECCPRVFHVFLFNKFKSGENLLKNFFITLY